MLQFVILPSFNRTVEFERFIRKKKKNKIKEKFSKKDENY